VTPIEFSVRGEPRPQPRPRAFARKMPNGKVLARVFDCASAEGWKSEIALAVRPHLPGAPLSGPLAVTIEFWMPRPENHFVASKRARGLKTRAPEFHTIRPDADNLAKAVLDAFGHLALWHEDDQVAKLTVTKRYEDPACGPGASIRIERPRGYLDPKPTPEQPLLISEGVST
jgi:Holliday junction resolvase RusA-like endonuclease